MFAIRVFDSRGKNTFQWKVPATPEELNFWVEFLDGEYFDVSYQRKYLSPGKKYTVTREFYEEMAEGERAAFNDFAGDYLADGDDFRAMEQSFKFMRKLGQLHLFSPRKEWMKMEMVYTDM